jgi:tRNA threonylcarbamoyladenosine biosynthesis protein TsaE
METLDNLEEFEAEVVRFSSSLSPSSQGATLVTLSGELGAGKTAFSQVVAKTLGVEESVTSPTFVLEKIYQLPQLGSEAPKFARLVHIDAYRLDTGRDLAVLGFDELMQDPKNLVLLEWPEKVADVLPTPSIRVSIIAHVNGSRTVTFG